MDPQDRACRSGPVVLWVLVLVALILAPLVRPGYLLHADMVSTPRQFLVPDAWGVGDAVPRAVPLDALMALVTTAVDGGLVVRLVLAGALVLAGLGAARLVPGGRPVRAGAATLMVWNPYVAERLLMGSWALLLAYGALPWAVGAALDLRRQQPGSGWRLTGWLALTCLTPPGAVLGAMTVLPVVSWPGGTSWLRRSALTAGVLMLLNLPWVVPSALHPSAGRSDAAGVEVFAARADSDLGLLGSLLGLGGIWNADAVPGSRQSPVASVFTVLVVLVAVPGLPRLRQAWGRGADGLVAASAVGVLVALWGALAPASLAWFVEAVPGFGLLRDGHRALAPLALLLACGAPLGFATLGRRRLPRQVRPTLAVGALLLPLVVLPDLAWGGAGRLASAEFPDEWDEARRILAEQPDRSDVVSLPWQGFRRFAWNDARSVLDPLPRYLDRTTVTSSDLVVATDEGPVGISGENPRSGRVEDLLATGRPLADVLPGEGIGWAVVAKDTPGEVSTAWWAGAFPLLDGEHLALYRLTPQGAEPPGSRPGPAAPAVAAVDLAVLAVAALAPLLAWSRRRGAAKVRPGQERKGGSP